MLVLFVLHVKKYARYVSVLNISASLSPLLSGIRFTGIMLSMLSRQLVLLSIRTYLRTVMRNSKYVYNFLPVFNLDIGYVKYRKKTLYHPYIRIDRE